MRMPDGPAATSRRQDANELVSASPLVMLEGGDVTHRLGYVAAWALAGVGLLYAAVVGAGIAEAGSDPIRDPILTVMEVLTLLAALLVVLVMAAVHERAEAASVDP